MPVTKNAQNSFSIHFRKIVFYGILLIALSLLFLFVPTPRILQASDSFRVTPALLDSVKARYGEYARRRVARWGEILETRRDTPISEKLSVVNSFFNQMMFTSDLEHWGVADYWATPLELLETQAGDCEDFALAKYFTLRELGIPADKLRLTYVKSIELNQAHMVLTFYKEPKAEPLVLDNLVAEIEPSSKRTDLVPIYSFNGDGLWLAKQRGLGKLVGGSDRISLWRGLTERMASEGLNLKR